MHLCKTETIDIMHLYRVFNVYDIDTKVIFNYTK